jgi:hypothetical protein
MAQLAATRPARTSYAAVLLGGAALALGVGALLGAQLWSDVARCSAMPACGINATDWSALGTGIALWVGGIVIWCFAQQDRSAWWIVLTLHLTAGVLATGFGTLWTRHLYALFVLWVAPAALLMNLSLIRAALRGWLRRAAWASVTVAALGTVTAYGAAFGWWHEPTPLLASDLFLLLTLSNYALLAWLYGRSAADARRDLRQIFLGSVLAALPLLLFSLGPATLGWRHVDFAFTFPCLVIFPLTYCAILFGRRLPGIDPVASSGATYY